MATPSREPKASFDGIVLAGGAGRRLGGVDKAAIEIGDVRLLDRALAALVTAHTRIVVGPPRELRPDVRQTQEVPSGGGPVPALVAGLDEVDCKLVAVLAVDHPNVTSDTIEKLIRAVEGYDAAIVVDEAERRQPLCGVYRTKPLSEALQVAGTDRMSDVIARLDAVTIFEPDAARDCDDWDAVNAARARYQPDGSFHTSTTTS